MTFRIQKTGAIFIYLFNKDGGTFDWNSPECIVPSFMTYMTILCSVFVNYLTGYPRQHYINVWIDISIANYHLQATSLHIFSFFFFAVCFLFAVPSFQTFQLAKSA